MLSFIIALIILLFLLIFLSIIWPPDSPWIPVKKEKIYKMLKMLKAGPKDIIYDLGSGDGRILILAAQNFGAKTVGIEIDPLRVFWSKTIIKFLRLSSKIKIIRGNFLKEDLSPATIVVVYLIPKALEKLKEKFLKELKPGTKIVSFRYPLDFLPPLFQDPKEEIFGYRVPGK